MPFPKQIREDALLKSRRCCCVCHEFAGLYTNVHHIKPEAAGGVDTIDNAIVLCLRCHGEAGHYNAKHPIGTQYSPHELRRHRDEWWDYCTRHPTKALPMRPISISPNSFRLAAGVWKTKLTLKVSNTCDSALYEVAVKVAILLDGIRSVDIRVDGYKRALELTHPVGDVEFAADLIRLDGVDSARHQAFVIYIHSIDPGETITMNITNGGSAPLSPQVDQHAVISLLGFSEDPSEMLVQENHAAFRFKSYEDWEATGMGVMLKRKT